MTHQLLSKNPVRRVAWIKSMSLHAAVTFPLPAGINLGVQPQTQRGGMSVRKAATTSILSMHQVSVFSAEE